MQGAPSSSDRSRIDGRRCRAHRRASQRRRRSVSRFSPSRSRYFSFCSFPPSRPSPILLLVRTLVESSPLTRTSIGRSYFFQAAKILDSRSRGFRINTPWERRRRSRRTGDKFFRIRQSDSISTGNEIRTRRVIECEAVIFKADLENVNFKFCLRILQLPIFENRERQVSR